MKFPSEIRISVLKKNRQVALKPGFPDLDSSCQIRPLMFWGLENGVGKQARGNQPPYRRYGPDTEIQYRLRKPHGLGKPSRILSKREADTEFQYRPHIVDTDTIADAVFADAISETSICALWIFRADFWEGDATKHFSVKKRGFQ